MTSSVRQLWFWQAFILDGMGRALSSVRAFWSLMFPFVPNLPIFIFRPSEAAGVYNYISQILFRTNNRSPENGRFILPFAQLNVFSLTHLFPLCRWGRQHGGGLVLASRGRGPALPVLWLPLQAGGPRAPPLTNFCWPVVTTHTRAQHSRVSAQCLFLFFSFFFNFHIFLLPLGRGGQKRQT